MIDLTTHHSPPGFPDDDDDSPDGGGPPRRASTLVAVDRIQRRTEADIAFFDRIAAVRVEIATLRHQRCHLTADILRDQMLCELEAWIDPSQKERHHVS